MLMAYVPVLAKAVVSMKLEEPEQLPFVMDAPPGAYSVKEQLLNVPRVRFSTTFWLAVPLNVNFALWPTALVVTVTGAPSIAIVPVISGGTLLSWRVSFPVYVE